MKRAWLLAFLFLTLWQMLPHEGYNMLYAQGMGDESYGGGYDCEDDLGPYSSSLPCDQTPCFEKCTICGGQFICDEFSGHSCEEKTHCPYCDNLLTQEEFLYHNCSTQDMGCLICGKPYEDCICEGPVITPNNPSVPPNTPSTGGGTHTGGGSGNNSNNNTQEDDSEDENLLSGEPMGKYWLEDSRHFTVSEVKSMIKYYDNSNIIHDLPNSFMEQGNKNDCTARSIATAAWIDSGEVEDYNLT